MKRTGMLKKHITWILQLSLAGSQTQTSAWHWWYTSPKLFPLSFILSFHKKSLTLLSHKVVYFYNKRLNRSPDDQNDFFLSVARYISLSASHTLSNTYTHTDYIMLIWVKIFWLFVRVQVHYKQSIFFFMSLPQDKKKSSRINPQIDSLFLVPLQFYFFFSVQNEFCFAYIIMKENYNPARDSHL